MAQTKHKKKNKGLSQFGKGLECWTATSSSQSINLALVYGVTIVKSLVNIGKRKSMLADGNCGHHGSMHGLNIIGKCTPTSMSVYRKDLHAYIVKRRYEDPPMSETIVTLWDQPAEQYLYGQRTTRTTKDWLIKVWDENVNYDDHGGLIAMKHWYDGKCLTGIKALKNRCSFMVYQEDVKTTEIYYYDDHTGKVTYACGPKGVYYSPLPNSVCLLFDGHCHYDVIEVSKRYRHNWHVEMRTILACDTVELKKRNTCEEVGNTLANVLAVNENDVDNPLAFDESVDIDGPLSEYIVRKVSNCQQSETSWGPISSYQLLNTTAAWRIKRRKRLRSRDLVKRRVVVSTDDDTIKDNQVDLTVTQGVGLDVEDTVLENDPLHLGYSSSSDDSNGMQNLNKSSGLDDKKSSDSEGASKRMNNHVGVNESCDRKEFIDGKQGNNSYLTVGSRPSYLDSDDSDDSDDDMLVQEFVICASGFPPDIKNHIKLAVLKLGGTYVREFEFLKVTHLIVNRPVGAKYEAWKEYSSKIGAGRHQVTAVTLDWLVQSQNKRMWQAESSFLAVDAEAEEISMGVNMSNPIQHIKGVDIESPEASSSDDSTYVLAPQLEESLDDESTDGSLYHKPSSGRNLAFTMSSPVKKKLTKNIRPDDLPHFWEYDEGRQPPIVKYHNVKLITKMVSVEDVQFLLNTTMKNGQVTQCDFNKQAKSRSDIFNEMIGSSFPNHFAPVHRNSVCHPIRDKLVIYCGRVVPMDLIAHFKGKCQCHKDGCKTTFDGGFDLNAITISAANRAPKVELKFQLNDQCVHIKDKEFGRLSGAARLREAKEVRRIFLSTCICYIECSLTYF